MLKYSEYLNSKQDETKKPEPVPEKKAEPKPFKLSIQKKDKSKIPEPEPEPEAPKMPVLKKKSSVRKELPPKEEEKPAFAVKLKKAETVKRTWDDGGLEKVDLKHHEFERPPQDIEHEAKSSIKLGQSLEIDIGDDKKKKKKKKKAAGEDEDSDEVIKRTYMCRLDSSQNTTYISHNIIYKKYFIFRYILISYKYFIVCFTSYSHVFIYPDFIMT